MRAITLVHNISAIIPVQLPASIGWRASEANLELVGRGHVMVRRSRTRENQPNHLPMWRTK